MSREHEQRIYDRCLLRVGQLEAENAKLREQYETVLADYRSEVAKLRKACAELLKMAERHDAEWLHWPEMHEELRELGVEVD